MIARLSAITAALAVGHAILSGLFWLLLSVPESNVVMLAASTLVVFLMVLVFGWVEGLGLIGWNTALPARQLPRRAFRAMPHVWLATLLFLGVAYLVSLLSATWVGHRGEIDAWLILHFGLSETGRLHGLAGWALLFLTYGVGLSLALALAETLIDGGVRAAASATWLRTAFSPLRLLTVAVLMLIFLRLPWLAVGWRPAWIAPNWQETAFVSVKLGVLFLLANIGWALALGVGRLRTPAAGATGTPEADTPPADAKPTDAQPVAPRPADAPPPETPPSADTQPL
jgi:hypothetical protein